MTSREPRYFINIQGEREIEKKFPRQECSCEDLFILSRYVYDPRPEEKNFQSMSHFSRSRTLKLRCLSKSKFKTQNALFSRFVNISVTQYKDGRMGIMKKSISSNDCRYHKHRCK